MNARPTNIARLAARLSLLALPLLAFACKADEIEIGSNQDAIACNTDNDCSQGQSCVNGGCTCNDPNDPACNPPACQTDADCAQGESCVNGACQPCDPNVDPACNPGEICGNGIDDDGDGQVDEGCNVQCQSDADCDPAQTCVNGLCQ